VHLKFLPGKSWTLLAVSAPGTPPLVAEWLEPYGPRSIQIAPGLTPKVLRAQFGTLPEAWAKVHDAVAVQSIELNPDGSASMFVQDSLARIQRFVAKVPGSRMGVRSRKTQSGPGRARLTARQLEALSLAVALGYFETPHRVSLRDLARRMGLSVGSVSQLIRRAQASVVTSYMDTLSAAQWQTGEAEAFDDPLARRPD